MDISIELSLYPLADRNYKEQIWSFIENLKQNKDINVVTNGMSTQVFGEYDVALSAVNKEMKAIHQITGSAVFILKIIAADRKRNY
ncbi:hypothetical protein HII17_12070 [Thalassotalea sp. M1531]|uniref:Thiamin/hydroxymethyl pyrimidine-binding YkoF putative domain-containing protein n=1 Tax=Thalassotalea algicola TaxID=2716224 RepID=A0A7Y0Q8L7_9GAMM|nr:hypothetical protein [Thalassotalea algicola]NMP32300.1 hypothetical protein [Thalassotalea algicola]